MTDTPVSAAPSPSPDAWRPLLTRWWVWCLLGQGLLFGLAISTTWLSIAVSTIGAWQLPDAFLVSALWVTAKPGLITLAAVSLAGWIGWGHERLGGLAGAVAGVGLGAFLLRTMPFAFLSVEFTIDSLLEVAGFAIWPSNLVFLALWVFVGPRGQWWRRVWLAAVLWALVTLPVMASGAISWGRLEPQLDRVFPMWVVAQLLIGFVPVVALLALRPREQTWRLKEIGKVAAFMALVAFGVPMLIPPTLPPHPEGYFQERPIKTNGWTEDDDLFPSWIAMGGSRGRYAFGQMTAAAEGIGARLPLPAPEYSRDLLRQSALDYPGYVLAHDLVQLADSRRYLRQAMAITPAFMDAFEYATITYADPLASAEDVAAMATLADLYPIRLETRRWIAEYAYQRGEEGLGDLIMAEAVAAYTRSVDLASRAGLCGSEDPHWGCAMPKWRETNHSKAWPLFGPPYEGNLTVVWDTALLPEIEESLLLAARPLHNPDKPVEWDSEETMGEWRLGGPVQLHPSQAGQTALAPLPVGRYALEVAYREYLRPDLEVWIVGMPREEIDIGPGHWGWQTTLTLLPASPLPFACAMGALGWADYPGAASYLVEAWHHIDPWARGYKELVAKEIVTGTSLGLAELLGEGAVWPSWGFRVVPLDQGGNEIIRADPLSVAALRAEYLGVEGCKEAFVSGMGIS